ncbi:serine hydrolase [Microcoleus vaginatus PCC 9802]|uniref:serine hydrolase n=1 Tax=Microcoleus vaginatus TaxID=119532 RepID=UPI00020D16BA|nr:beta-lactamase [Microcoleus vaginatus FGP-2]UNU19631.1 serine hydrolase [Microcoleus vaginatus PCC 9802]
MAERFPKGSILSVISSSISSPNSGSKQPKPGKASPSGNSGRRRPPQPQNANSEIRSPEPATLPLQQGRGSRIGANSPTSSEEFTTQDFLSDPRSAINPRKPRTSKTPQSKTRQPGKKGLAAVDMFEFPNPNLERENVSSIASNPNSQLPTATPPATRGSRPSSPPVRISDTVIPADAKKPPLPKPRPQASPRPGKRSAPRSVPPLVYATRLLILGVGIAVICGTLLSVVNAVSRASTVATEEQTSTGQNNPADSASAAPAAPEVLQLNQELGALKTQVQVLATENPSLTAGIFLVDLDTGSYLNFNGDTAVASASTIKVPILVAFFQAVDEGKVQLDQMLTLKSEHIVGGSGEMQDQAPGKKYSALEVAQNMIVVSDNTATNMMIELLGGAEVLNQHFANWGLSTTVLRNNLPDLEGTNTTSPKDLINIIAQVDRGNLVSVKSRDRILQIMRQTQNASLLPKGLGEGSVIAHKTGNIDTMLADAGMVDLPNGKRYLVAVMVKHSPETEKPAQTLIREISRISYRYLNGEETPADSQVKIKN